MTDEVSTKAKKKPSKKLVVVVATAVLVIGGGAALAAGVSNYTAETARLCAVALDGGARATKDAKASIEKADTVLEAVTSTTLPAGTGTSTSYADRPGIGAVDPVAAVPASDTVAAVAEVTAVPARASGADQVSATTKARAALVKITMPTKCTDRDQAAAVTSKAAEAKTAARTLDTSGRAMTADFTLFQTDEAARIAAEIEAARVAAEAEAARVAAAQAAAKRATDSGSGSSSSGGSSISGGSSSGGGTSSGGGSSGTPGGGGGRVGTGGGTGDCPRVDNGMGGFVSC